MRRCLILAALVAGCGGGDGTYPDAIDPGQRPAQPGESMGLAAPISAALGCPAPDLTWTALDGGSVTAAGVYTSPACGAATFPATFHVEAKGCGKTATIEIPVQEAVVSIRVCGPTAMAPGTSAQFAAAVTYSCPGHVEISPPGVTCP